MTPAQAAYENWLICFEQGRYRAARNWWNIYYALTFGGK
jgi:hypothetical protein